MKHKTFAKILLPLVFLTFTLGCTTVKGWVGSAKIKLTKGPRRFWPRKASRI